MQEQVLQFLKQTPGVLYTFKDIGKRVDREHYREDANWARPVAERLVAEKSICKDNSGFYYYPE